MLYRTTAVRRRARVTIAALVALAGGITATTVLASDHQDTPEVELSPRMDINDVYAFPGASADRIVLVMTTSSPITPAQGATAGFDPKRASTRRGNGLARTSAAREDRETMSAACRHLAPRANDTEGES